eukprot:1112425-Rhodomonas_salina.2
MSEPAGKVLLNHPLETIEVGEDGSVQGFKIRGIKDPNSGDLLTTRTFTADSKWNEKRVFS